MGSKRRIHWDISIDGNGELAPSGSSRGNHPAAAFLAAQGRLDLSGVLIAGILGSYFGASVMYWVSRWVGRPLILRFGRYAFLTPAKLQEAEHWLNRYEAGGVFFARILPIVRHLISIPAGVVRMNFGTFSLVTVAGSALACGILAYLGDKAYRLEPQLLSDPDALVHFVRSQSSWILIVVGIFAVLYILTMRLARPQNVGKQG